MSQKVVSKKVNTKSNAAQKQIPSKKQITKKKDEILTEKQNVLTNKVNKTSINAVNKNDSKHKTSLTSNDNKKIVSNKNVIKAIETKATNSLTKTTQKSNADVKQNTKPFEKSGNHSKNSAVNIKQKLISDEKQKKQLIVIQNNTKKKSTDNKYSVKGVNNSIVTTTVAEKQQIHVSSNEQKLSLSSLDTNSPYKQYYGTSSESILAEPPSICGTELNDIIDNISDTQSDDYGSDYYDDFEDYESDFEDEDEDEDDEEEEEESAEQGENEEYSNVKSLDNKYVYKNEDALQSHEPKNTVKHNSENNLNSKVLESNHTIEETNRQIENKVESTFLSIADIKSAHLKFKSNLQMNEAIKRGKELLDIIKLNKIGFTNCDLPPINYDIFIRTFGKRDAKQVSCQTSEREDIQIQTEPVIFNNKWTQNPSFTRIHTGNEDEENKVVCPYIPNIDPFKLSKFLIKAETIISALIHDEFKAGDNQNDLPTGADQFSKEYSILKCLGFVNKCPISYTFTNSLNLFCVQNVSQMSGSTEKSVISVWNLFSRKQPEKILICRSHIICAYSYDTIVVAAMIDGSVALWDLKEESNYNKEITIESNHFILRSPSYNTALTGNGHNFAVVDITNISYQDLEDNSLHFATIDEMGFLVIWAIIEVKGDMNDFGISPTSYWKLSRISIIQTLKNFQFDAKVRITAFECQPNDWSQFYCGTDNGLVIRCSRVEESVSQLPTTYSNSELNSFSTSVTKINFNKLDKSCFLVGYSDGIISYYSIANQNPLNIFETKNSSISELKWFPSSGSTFMALNKSNQIFIWDLIDRKLLVYYTHKNYRLLSFSLWKGINTIMIFGTDCGNALLFTLK